MDTYDEYWLYWCCDTPLMIGDFYNVVYPWFSHHLMPFVLLFCISCLLLPKPSYSEDLSLQSMSLRARISEQTVLGKEASEDFEEYDVSAHFSLPWQRYSSSGWGVATRLMVSAGLLRGASKEALVVSVIPELTLGSEDGRYILDMGAGVTTLSRYRFGDQDYGGHFQFALTVGAAVPLYKKLGLGYRYLHYSDAGVNGSDTTGADLHMIEFNYRF